MSGLLDLMPQTVTPTDESRVTLPPNTRGLIFDCDGTLADTMDLHYRAWVQALEEREAFMPREVFFELAGVPTLRIVEILNERYGFQLDPEEVGHAKEALYEEILPQLQPIQCVVELVYRYQGTLPMAVASGGLRRLVEKTLKALDLDEHFLAVCTAEDVEHGKPAPDLFLLAARQLGVPPETCVVFEDADLGLEAARRAGMQGVDIRPWLPQSGAKGAGG